MITKFKTLVLALSITACSIAQVSMPNAGQVKTATNQMQTMPAGTPAIPATKEGLGNLVGQLTNNISPSSFTDAFAKDKPAFVNKANTTTTPPASASLLQSLAGGLKPSAFKAEWAANKGKWFAAAKTAATSKQAASLISELESNIDPKSFKGEWTKVRPMWDSALKKL